MLNKLHIAGFKTIVDSTLEFGRVNLFIGANGSGKSNILEAIGVLSSALGRDITDVELQRKGVRLSVPALFKSAYKNRKLRATFDLKAELDDGVSYDVSITASDYSGTLRFFSEHIRYNNKKYLGRSNHGISVYGFHGSQEDISKERGIWDRYGEVINAPSALSTALNGLAKFCVYAPQTPFLRGTDIEAIPVKPLGLYGGGLPQAALAVLHMRQNSRGKVRELVDRVLQLVWMPGWADQFSVGKFRPDLVSSKVLTGESTLYFRDKFMKSGRNTLSAYDGSEGSLYLLFIAILVLHSEAPKMFALDNVDNSLNPSATRGLLEILLDLTCSDAFSKHGLGPEQLFLTSHNPTALDAFDLFNEDHRVFVVKRNDSGYTEVTRLKPHPGMTPDDWVRVRKGKNLSEMWIGGLIPNALGPGAM